jgi:hypothetical protein
MVVSTRRNGLIDHLRGPGASAVDLAGEPSLSIVTQTWAA